MISVLSYNILFGKRLEEIILWLNSLPTPFDTICFQEFPYSQRHLLKGLENNASYKDSFALSFKRKDESYGLMTLINTKKIAIQKEKIVHIGTSAIEKAMGFTGGRNVLITHGTYNGTPVVLINAHLVAFSTNRHRRNQLTQVVTELEKDLQGQKTPVVLMGDLNYSSLLWKQRLHELMDQHGFANAYEHNTHRLLFFKNQQLDYVFYRHAKIGDIKIYNLPYSDHQPITFTVSLS